MRFISPITQSIRSKKYSWRFYFLCSLLTLVLAGLIWRIVDLGVVKRDFLLRENSHRTVREIEIPAHRGKILDRNGELLAQSVPIDSAWANPKDFNASPAQLQQLSQILEIPLPSLKKKLEIDVSSSDTNINNSVNKNTANTKNANSNNNKSKKKKPAVNSKNNATASNSAALSKSSENAATINIDEKNGKQERGRGREFVYLKRHIPAAIADKIKELKIPGVFLQQEYQRYYPDAEVTTQVVGFTNIDDKGQEGLELAYNDWLRGTPGKQRILKDRLGNTIENLAVVVPPQEGHDLVLSIDRRIQYLTYQELKNTVTKYQAESGIAVVLSVKTGEVLAMVSVPTCNPNKREGMNPACYKNKAITDLFEPGSTAKAFTIANALESGKYKPDTLVDTNPGQLKVEKHIIYDDAHRNNGVLTVTGVLQKSSDIGVTKITLSLPPESLLSLLKRVGFGQTTQSGFPGEATGIIPERLKGRPLMLATIAYGYGISTTALQLAHAYAIIANNGIEHSISLLKDGGKTQKNKEGVRVITQEIANQILTMLQSAVELGGTGKKARIQGYNVAGKTGTSRIAKPHGYYSDRHGALFAGIAPASRPELVTVIVIRNPHGQYHGGSVAAPAFANIMHGALRILNIPPDVEQDETAATVNPTTTSAAVPATVAATTAVMATPKKNITKSVTTATQPIKDATTKGAATKDATTKGATTKDQPIPPEEHKKEQTNWGSADGTALDNEAVITRIINDEEVRDKILDERLFKYKSTISKNAAIKNKINDKKTKQNTSSKNLKTKKDLGVKTASQKHM